MNDTISRQQTITALRALSDEDGYINVPHEVVTDVVRGLPPVRAEHEQTAQPEQTKTDKLGVKTGETCEDCISRQAAIDALRYAQHRFTVADEAGGMGTVKWSEDVIYFAAAKRVLDDLPSAQPEQPERCSDCEWWTNQPEIIRCRNCKFASGDSRICMQFGHSPIGELDFCAWAERRTDEE